MELENNLELAKKLWSQLGDIPVNNEDEIDTEFYMKELDMGFKKGTDKIEIWGWFEEVFKLSVAEDLMYQINKKHNDKAPH